jgi:predicted amidohydrolase YtcJ
MPAADLVLVGDVYTVDAARSWAGAVAVSGDRIVGVGTEADVRERFGSAASLMTGAAILPGFQDAHVHPSVGGRNLLNVNLDDLATKEGYLERIRAFADANPELDWIVGGGWYNPVFASTEGPRKEDLDAVVADRPVFLLNTDVHAAWANTKLLEIAGISSETPDPWDGYFVRDPDGTPTGCLQEGAAYDVLHRVVPRSSTEVWEEYLRTAQRELHALGITGWQDAWVEGDLLRAYRALDDDGQLTMRVVAALWWDRHQGLEQIHDLENMREWGTAGRVRATTVKIMLDGCPESCTASMLDPFEGPFGEEHGAGIQFLDAKDLNEAVVALDAAGFQVHQHALGDRAVRSALDAVEAARSSNGTNDHRHHVAHLQLPQPSDVPRLRELGVVANVQPYWSQPDPLMEQMTKPRVGERAAHLYPIGDIRKSGAVLCFGSDWPVSTPNPFLEMEVAVTRAVPGGSDGPVLAPEQRIDLQAAIAAFTRGSAFVNHDDDAGSIEEGKRADLVVLDRNPFEREAGQIGLTKVTTTIASGRVVYEAG